MPNVEAWVVFLDVYGFGNPNGEELFSTEFSRLRGFWKNIQSNILNHEFEPIVYIFQDSAFLIYPVPQSKKNRSADKLKFPILETCVENVRLILDAFVKAGMTLRGGIAYGTVSCEKRELLGAPITRAVNYEKWIPAPLVLLPVWEVYRDLGQKPSTGTDYYTFISLKDKRTIYGRLIPPYSVEDFATLAKSRRLEYAHKGPFEHATRWHQALEYVAQYILGRNF